MSRLLCLLLLIVGVTAADPYEAWTQGRPAESVAPLIAHAENVGHWDAWLDAGLAAAASGHRGEALACLAMAHHLAPERAEPRDAMRVLGAALPTTWCERAGPLAVPGSGWSGMVLCGLAGLAIGAGLGIRRGRWLLLGSGALALFIALPGAVAPQVDRLARWIVTVRDTAALDSTGAPVRSVAEGTLVHRDGDQSWGGRTLVRLPDGAVAWIATNDLTPGR